MTTTRVGFENAAISLMNKGFDLFNRVRSALIRQYMTDLKRYIESMAKGQTRHLLT